MAARKKTALKIYQLHVELEDIEPIIWRRILVPPRSLCQSYTICFNS